MYEKKSVFTCILWLCGFFLWGCSGFTTDGVTQPYPSPVIDYSREFAFASIYAKIPMQIVKDPEIENQGTIILEYGRDGWCQKSGDSVKWHDEWLSEGVDSLRYSFRGDTLLLTTMKADESTGAYNQGLVEVSQIFIGGEIGVPSGIWKESNDVFVNGKLVTHDYGYVVYYKFEEDSLTIAYDSDANFGFTSSIFMDKLHALIASGGNTENPQPRDIFFKKDVMSHDVTIVRKANKYEEVLVNGVSYVIYVNAVDYVNGKVSVKVDSGDRSCTETFVRYNLVPPELCLANNNDYLISSEEDAGVVSYYANCNEDEFRTCIRWITEASKLNG